MSDLTHDIPPWYIPDGTQVIANEAEKEEIEQEGELEEPLCPHCGMEYEKEFDGRYVHRYRPVDGPGEWEQTPNGLVKFTEVEPAMWCDSTGERRHIDREMFGF